MRQKRIGGIAIIIGFILTACIAQAGSGGSQYVFKNETAVVAAKATDQTNQLATLAALPSSTPTATPPVGVLPCDTANLTASAVSQGATGAIVFSIQITNHGSTVCKLQGWPNIQIVDQQSEPLVLQSLPFCYDCTPPGSLTATPVSGEQTAGPPAATATAQAILQTPVILAPGKNARLFLVWRNWCPPFPNGGVNLLMTLSTGSGELTIPTEARTGGRCDVPTAGSTLLISQFLP